jgi:hypothetical protein
MTKIIFLIFTLAVVQLSYAQNKKEQIEILNNRVDSLKIAFQNEISIKKTEIEKLESNSKDLEVQKNNLQIKIADLNASISEFKLSNYLLKDSLSVCLKNIIELDSTNKISLLRMAELNTQNSNKDVVNFRDNFDTKSLYQLRNNFDSKNKITLVDYYSHFINCAIAEDIIRENKLTDISKKNLVKLIGKNISDYGFENLLISSTNELDSISAALNKLVYDQFRKEVIVVNYGLYMSYDFSKLEEGTYLFTLNISGTGSSFNSTMLTNRYYSGAGSYSSLDLDDLLVSETELLMRKLNKIYRSSFSRYGAQLKEINGKNYFVVYFSEEFDYGSGPSILVAIPSFSNDNYYQLDKFYIEKEYVEENKPIKWKKLN